MDSVPANTGCSEIFGSSSSQACQPSLTQKPFCPPRGITSQLHKEHWRNKRCCNVTPKGNFIISDLIRGPFREFKLFIKCLARQESVGLIMIIIKDSMYLLKKLHKHCGSINNFSQEFPFLFSNWGKQNSSDERLAQHHRTGKQSPWTSTWETCPSPFPAGGEPVPTRHARIWSTCVHS